MAVPGLRLRSSLVTRRQFLDGVLQAGALALAGLFAYPAVRYMWGKAEPTPASIRLSGAATLPAGGSRLFKYGSKPGLLIRTEEGAWRAFSAVCTHLECTVRYERNRKRIRCACHDGVYNLAGENVSGPPPRPLSRYVVQVDGEDLVISLPHDA